MNAVQTSSAQGTGDMRGHINGLVARLLESLIAHIMPDAAVVSLDPRRAPVRVDRVEATALRAVILLHGWVRAPRRRCLLLRLLSRLGRRELLPNRFLRGGVLPL